MSPDPVSPNMGLTLPVAVPAGNATLGPAYANEINNDLNIIDTHDHAPGGGVQITPAGLNISSDLNIQSNNLTNVRSGRMAVQTSEFVSGTDVNCIYNFNGNLVWRDNVGNNVQITASGGINISSVGTIGGDYGQPGVPASVVYSNTTKTFSFTRSSTIGAIIGGSEISLAAPSVGTQSVSITAPADASAWVITLPSAAPIINQSLITVNTDGTTTVGTTLSANLLFSGANTLSGSFTGGTYVTPTLSGTVAGTPTFSGVLTITSAPIFSSVTASQVLAVDGSKQLTSIGTTGTGNVVKDTNPVITGAVMGAATAGCGIVPLGGIIATASNLTGAYNCTATTAADAQGYVQCNGQTIADASSPMNGQVVPNINNSVFLMGSTTSGSTGGSNSTTLTSTQLPSHTHTFTSGNANSSLAHTHGAGTFATTLGVTGGTASLTGTTTFAANGHTHTGAPHIHQWGYSSTSQSYVYALNGASGTENQSSFNSGDGNRITFLTYNYVNQNSGTSFGMTYTEAAQAAWTAGPANNGQTGSNSSAATVGISSTAASLTGSNAVGGTSSSTDLTVHTHSGTTASTGSGSAYDSRPSYISAKYVIRIK